MATLTKCGRQPVIVSQHGLEGIDAVLGEERAEVEIADALLEDPLVDPQHGSDPGASATAARRSGQQSRG
jgi:hypothetical protein